MVLRRNGCRFRMDLNTVKSRSTPVVNDGNLKDRLSMTDRNRWDLGNVEVPHKVTTRPIRATNELLVSLSRPTLLRRTPLVGSKRDLEVLRL